MKGKKNGKRIGDLTVEELILEKTYADILRNYVGMRFMGYYRYYDDSDKDLVHDVCYNPEFDDFYYLNVGFFPLGELNQVAEGYGFSKKDVKRGIKDLAKKGKLKKSGIFRVRVDGKESSILTADLAPRMTADDIPLPLNFMHIHGFFKTEITLTREGLRDMYEKHVRKTKDEPEV